MLRQLVKFKDFIENAYIDEDLLHFTLVDSALHKRTCESARGHLVGVGRVDMTKLVIPKQTKETFCLVSQV